LSPSLLEQFIQERFLPGPQLLIRIETPMAKPREVGDAGQANRLAFARPYLELRLGVVRYLHGAIIASAPFANKQEVREGVGLAQFAELLATARESMR
jgi:hypothetical protein